MALSQNIVFRKCKSKRCLTCPDLVCETTFTASSTNRIFEGVYLFDDQEERVLTCKSTNCIYLLTCKKCLYQYVGETVQELRNRMSGHRSSVDNDSSCVRVKEHFSLFCDQGFNIHIIGKLPGNGRTSVRKGKSMEIDSDTTVKRRDVETEWIRKIQSSYPYGMNTKLDNVPEKSKHNSTFGLMISTKDRRKRSWSKNYSLDMEKLRCMANQIVAYTKLKFHPRFIVAVKKLLFTLHKKALFALRDLLMGKFMEGCSLDKLESSPLYVAILDFFTYKLDPFVKKPETPKRRPKNVCTINFINKGIEMLHMPSIFRKCKSAAPCTEDKVPDVAYKYGDTIVPKLLNFKQTVTSYDGSKPLSEQYSCACQEYSSFIEPSCGHVATGDLSIISNRMLQDLICKGPRYREPKSIDLDRLYTSVDTDIKQFVKSWSDKQKIAPQCFNEWYHKVMLDVRERIEYIKKHYERPKYQSVFNVPDAMACLTDLKTNFVLVPVDKASKNIAVICKRYYMEVLLKEMNTNVSTYCALQQSSCDLALTHQDFLKSHNLVPPCDKIPYCYWTPKFHKPTLSQRFIVSYADCAIKPLAKKLALALGVVLKQIESFGSMLKRNTGINHCWIINNSTAIVDHLLSINDRSSGRNITTYDFTTLYTMLSHADILESMTVIIDLAFKKSKYKYIAVYEKSGSWCNKPRSTTFKFDASALKTALEFVLEHSYFSVGTVCYQQSIGIPIGIDCAPPIANLTLFRYEYGHMAKLLKSDYRRATKFNGCFRLMDDISSINSDGVFEESIPQIYPASLALKKENEGHNVADILDLTVELSVDSHSFGYKLYDKRDKFKFNIVNYPDLCGNISSNCCYGVVKSELKRFAKLSSKFSEFVKRKNILFEKLINKSYSEIKLNRIFNSISFKN